MTPLAEQTLASKLAKGLSPTRAPRETTVYSTADLALDIDDINVSGPINQVMRIEGRRYALDMIRDASASLTNTAWTRQLIQVLIRAAIAQPPSIARGMREIIEMIGEPR